jgi:hypothetical protein
MRWSDVDLEDRPCIGPPYADAGPRLGDSAVPRASRQMRATIGSCPSTVMR